MSGHTLAVIGIGYEGPSGLTAVARGHIESARVLAGGRRHLDFFRDSRREKIILGSDARAFVEALQQRYSREKTVVLASGDPLFYGIGRALLELIPRDDLLFLPHLSGVQLAFARVKESWQDAHVVSLHGRPEGALVAAIRARELKIAVLTDATNHPAAIAGILRRLGAADAYELWVCENLGGTDERISRHSPADLSEATFSPLNVVILLATGQGQTPDTILGIPESALLHKPGPRGMITQREIRLLALCYLELRPGDIMWDIGAGSGSMSLEAGRHSPRLKVFAIECDAEALARLESNVADFGAPGVCIVAAEAPDGLADLPDPDAVFVGGSGGRLAEILTVVGQRLKPGGRVVINCITVETLSLGWELLGKLGLEPEATSVQLAHSRPLGRFHSMEPENPITILRGRSR